MRVQNCLLVLLLLFSPLAIAEKAEAVQLPPDTTDALEETLGTVTGTIGFRPSASSNASLWVGGAIAATELPVISGSLVFRKMDSMWEGSIDFARHGGTKGGVAKDLKDGDFKYLAFSMKLPEGNYEIIRVTAVYPKYVGGLRCLANCYIQTENANLFSVPFEVKRGKTLYLGSFLAHSTVLQAKLGGVPQPDNAYFSYYDKWPRDKAVLLKMAGVGIDETLVEHALLAVNEKTEFFIIAEDHVPEAKLRREDIAEGRTTHAAKIKTYQAEKGLVQ